MRKTLKFINIICLLFYSLSIYGQSGEYQGIRNLDNRSNVDDFPFISYNPPPDGLIRSFFSGETVQNIFFANGLNNFRDGLVIQIKEDYTLYGQNQETTYYVMVFDFDKSATPGRIIAPGDILGQIRRDRAKVLVFSETLDPFLVINSGNIPVFYNGYYWFEPAFLSSAGTTRWLSFDPVDNIEILLNEIANHQSESPGFSWYNQRIRFNTSLQQYPRSITDEERRMISTYENILYGRTGITSFISEVKIGNFSYLLCWQNGFLNYLRMEYSLRNEIWLYGVIATFDPWENRGYIFIRDFSTNSIEDIYEGRLRELRGN